MKETIKNILTKNEFPEESIPTLLDAYDKLISAEGSRDIFHANLNKYEERGDARSVCSLSCFEEAAEVAGVHQYTAAMVFLLMMLSGLGEKFRKAGYPAEQELGVINDLKYKLIECKLVKGVWGTFVPSWYAGFFEVRRFTFGKLQFELVDFKHEYEKNGVRLTPESKVINVHIPRTGGRLDPEARKASYAEAAEFFSAKFGISPIFVCHSWLLFPKNDEILKTGSNLRGFFDEYDIIESGNYTDYTEIWRLFDCDYKDDPDLLPADSSLRRAYVELIKRGEPTGWGFGVFVYS